MYVRMSIHIGGSLDSSLSFSRKIKQTIQFVQCESVWLENKWQDMIHMAVAHKRKYRSLWTINHYVCLSLQKGKIL